MKKQIIIALAATLGMLPATAQSDRNKPGSPVILTGSRLDVESLNGHIDPKTDISKLSLSDLRILRNAFAARQGYCFMDYAMRSVFSHTSWYDSLLWKRYDSDEADAPLKYTAEETALIERIKAREAELRARNFTGRDGKRVNTDNIVNAFQLEEVSRPLMDRLARDGFAIVPRQNIQLFHCYENNDYHDFPNFVTTDMHMQLLHMYFSNILEEIERTSLSKSLKVIVTSLHGSMKAVAAKAQDGATREAAEHNMAYLAICGRLLGTGDAMEVPARYRQTVAEEVEKVMQCADATSPFLGYDRVEFMYSQFRPRGNYSRSEDMKRYFRAMMWFQYTPRCLGDKREMRRAVLLADAANSNFYVAKGLRRIDTALQLLVGQSDGVSLLDLAGRLKAQRMPAARLMTDDRALARLMQTMMQLSRSKTRIRPKIEVTCPEKMWLMPQRYLYDNEVLQELVDVKTMPETRRGNPKGLDVMAAFGSAAAGSILIKELKEAEQWPEYARRLDSVKAIMPQMSRDSTVYNLWMKAVTAMQTAENSRYPYFMKTPQWDRKNLNAALASWTELKHDVVLYSKQAMAAECGGAIPDPVVVGYVEPNVAYWQSMLGLLRHVRLTLERNGLLTQRSRTLTAQIEEQTQFLLDMSEKELAGRRLTESEFRSIEKIGSTYEWLTLDIIKGGKQNDGMVWEDVQGPDKSVSVVTDVYTANAPNNPRQGVLHEGVGFVDDIFVVVEINGLLHLTRGAVFSYREFMMPPGERLTDEEWQQMLEKDPRMGVPSWMDGIIMKEPVPADNELIFYSSGC
ncbi:MAG: DUF3160 domain-containing protein [Prevotella sp.]|nr:DUF3160 domain-containing protein [Prevotella sp.]